MAITYKCPACGDNMTFDGETGNLVCDSCGAMLSIDEAKSCGDQEHYETAQNRQDVETEDFKVYHCASCGAEMLTDEHTSATICSFCGTPGLLEDRLTGQVKPSKVIPFHLTKEDAVQKFRKWTKNGLLTPKSFTAQNTIEKIVGMYVPYWLYDYSTDVSLAAHCTRTRMDRRGDYEYIYTDHYQVYRDVAMQYDRIPADASEKMEDNLMDKLEPFQYQELVSFDMPYLAGYLSEKYNYTSKELQERAKGRVRDYAFNTAGNTINGYATVNIYDRKIRIREENANYVLMPVWMLNYRYQGKNYQIAINGQTGKLVGNLPISKGKVAGWFGSITVGLFMLFSVIGGLIG